MKRIHFLTLGFIATVSLLATSCEREYITEEYYTEYGSKVYTREYAIRGDEWQEGYYGDGRKYLFAECEDPDITNNVVNKGAVLVYYWFMYDAETNSCSWNMLPYVYPFLYTNEAGDTLALGENFRFEYEKGLITFVVEDLNSDMPFPMGDETIFKVVAIENR